MDLGFLEGGEREKVVRLLSVTGNSQLVGEELYSKELRSLGPEEFLESCLHLSEQHLAIAAQGRPEDLLLSCLFAAAKSPNQGVSCA